MVRLVDYPLGEAQTQCSQMENLKFSVVFNVKTTSANLKVCSCSLKTEICWLFQI